MSCPHPSEPVERIVGGFSELVCRDCHARFESIEEVLPVVSVENVDAAPAKPAKRARKAH